MSTPQPARGPSLRRALVDYLDLRRALGFKLATAGRLLGQFVDHVDARGLDTVTTEEALTWAMLPAGASRHWLAIRVSVVRGFVAYLHGIDPTVPVLPAGLIRAGSCRATPYLYSEAEIDALIRAAVALAPGLRAATYQSLIGLLVVSGIRIDEAIALDDADLDDADLDDAQDLLVIRDTKFGKDRLVPLHPSTTRALAGYQQLRRTLLPRSASPALFLSTVGTRLLHSNINFTLARLLEQAGLTRRSASCRPRIHDYADLRVMPTSAWSSFVA